MNDANFGFDPAKFPKKLDLTLPPELAAELSGLAERSGRSLDEVIVELLDQAIHNDAAPHE